MDIDARLQGQRDVLLRKIKAAAEKGDTRAVLANGQSLATVERLMAEFDALARNVESLEADMAVPPSIPSTNESFLADAEPLSEARSTGRSRGEARRLEFVKTLPPGAQPVNITSAATFRARSGLRIGVAYAKERRTNRWFLGLQDRAFEHAILLCETNNGKVLHFSLGRHFLAKYQRALANNGQVKFNVSRRGGQFYLVVPRTGRVSIEPFRDNYDGLQ